MIPPTPAPKGRKTIPQNLPKPAVLAAEIVEDLEEALEEFRAVEEELRRQSVPVTTVGHDRLSLNPMNPVACFLARRVVLPSPRVLATALLAGVLAVARCAAADPALTPPGKGTVLFETGFEGTNALAKWTGAAQLTAGFQSAQAVFVEAPAAAGNVGIQLKLDSREWLGCTVLGTAMIKAENVSAKPNAWNGIKFMLALETPDQRLWPQAPIETGSFDWRRVAFTVRIPTNTTAATLHLGLELVAGKVWFDDVKFTVVKPPLAVKPVPFAGPAFTGHDLPRLRGTMVSPQIDAASLRMLGREWNANLIRWQLIRPSRPGQTNSPAEYDAWLEGELRRFDAALPECERDGLMVALDLHSPPGGKGTDGGYAGSDSGLFTDRRAQDKFVEVWKKLATRYRGAKAIWGYDLANEPVEEFVEDGCDDWHDLAERAARAIREIDPARALIVEAPPWGGPSSLAGFMPLAVSNVVYSVHMYEPIAFTHQGVFKPSGPVSYPGEIAGKRWDRRALEAALQPAIEFQRAWNVQIYLGEFSAIRWAPGDSAQRYLADVIAIAEEHGWDWSYHAFREWQGWSVEYGGDRADTQPAAAPTDREQLLRSWFARNRKPKW
jgi:hypothetical protein